MTPEQLIIETLQQYGGWAAVAGGFAVLILKDYFKSREHAREQDKRDAVIEDKLFKRYEDTIAEYRQQIADYKAQVASLSQAVADLKNANIALTSELADVSRQMVALRESHEEQLRITENALMQLGEAKQALELAQKRNDELQAKNTVLEHDNQRLYTDWRETDKRFSDCQEEVKKIRFTITQLQAELAQRDNHTT